MSRYFVPDVRKSLSYASIEKKILTEISDRGLINENFPTYFLKTEVNREWSIVLKSKCLGLQISESVITTFLRFKKTYGTFPTSLDIIIPFNHKTQ